MFESTEGVKVVVDDILVQSETEEQHDVRLIQVMEQGQADEFMLSKAKCYIKSKKLATQISHNLSKKV